jgi:hypothetical protein
MCRLLVLRALYASSLYLHMQIDDFVAALFSGMRDQQFSSEEQLAV